MRADCTCTTIVKIYYMARTGAIPPNTAHNIGVRVAGLRGQDLERSHGGLPAQTQLWCALFLDTAKLSFRTIAHMSSSVELIRLAVCHSEQSSFSAARPIAAYACAC